MTPVNNKIRENVPDSCPHCGYKLSPWQQVLLGIDRALVCKNCWYRIIIDAYEDKKPKPEEPKGKEDQNGIV